MQSLPRALAALLFCLSVIPFAQAQTTEKIAKSLKLDGYEIQFIADPEIPFTASMKVSREGQPVYRGAFVTHLGALDEEPGARNSAFPLPPGTDVTGNGKPNLALLAFSGGAHCCFTLEIYQLEPNFAQLAKIEGENSPPLLKQPEEGGAYTIELADWTFAYWHAPFVEAPSPLVVLAWTGKDYQPDADLMRKEPLTENALDRKVAELGKQIGDAGKPVPSLWREMLELIYGGNGDQAFDLLDRAWPEDLAGRSAYLLQFGAQLGLSPYYAALISLNAWPDF